MVWHIYIYTRIWILNTYQHACLWARLEIILTSYLIFNTCRWNESHFVDGTPLKGNYQHWLCQCIWSIVELKYDVNDNYILIQFSEEDELSRTSEQWRDNEAAKRRDGEWREQDSDGECIFSHKRICKTSSKTLKGTSNMSRPVKKRRSALDCAPVGIAISHEWNHFWAYEAECHVWINVSGWSAVPYKSDEYETGTSKEMKQGKNVYMVSVDSIQLNKSEKGNDLQLLNGEIYFLLVRCIKTGESFHLYFLPGVYNVCIYMYLLYFTCSIWLINIVSRVVFCWPANVFFGTMRHKSIQIVLNQNDCDWTWNMVNNCLISCQLLFLAYII